MPKQKVGRGGGNRRYAFSGGCRKRKTRVQENDSKIRKEYGIEDLVVVQQDGQLILHRFLRYEAATSAEVQSLDGKKTSVFPVAVMFSTEAQLGTATVKIGDYILVLTDLDNDIVMVARCTAVTDHHICIAFNSNGLTFSVPIGEFFSLPNEIHHTEIDFTLHDDSVQNSLQIFSSMLKKLNMDHVNMCRDYKDACIENEKNKELCLTLKRMHLNDIQTLKEIKERWTEKFRGMSELNESLQRIICEQKEELNIKNKEIALYKNEILDLQRQIQVKDSVLFETEKRLKIQIEILKDSVVSLKARAEKEEKEKGVVQVELLQVEEQMAELGAEMENTKMKIEKMEGQNLLEVREASGKKIIARAATSGKRTSQFVKVPQPTVPSSKANFRSLSERSQSLRHVLELLSNSTEPKQEDLVTTLTHFVKSNKEIVLEACKNAKVAVIEKLSPGDCLDLKVLLKLPMSRFRDLRTFLDNNGIRILANEGLMRAEILKRYDSNAMVEVGVVNMMKNGVAEKLSAIAFCRIKSVLKTVQHVHQRHVKSGSKFIEFPLKFQGELWLKLGGDKGGTSTKLVLELANLVTCNAPENTEILALFEAYDSYENVWEVFSPLRNEVSEISDKCIDLLDADGNITDPKCRLFIFGDYAWLCNILGHQGAASSFPCIYCLVPLGHLRERSEAPHTPQLWKDGKWVLNPMCVYESRDDESFQRFLAGFENDKRNPGKPSNNGKYHGSIIRECLFPVPINQVVPPPLHIFLGLVKLSYELLEKHCIQLDRQGMSESEKEDVKSLYEKWQQLTEDLTEVGNELKDAKSELQAKVSFLKSVEKQFQKANPGDEDRECASPICIESGRGGGQVLWVGCSKCELWVHRKCAAIGDHDNIEIDEFEYLCYACDNVDTSEKMIQNCREGVEIARNAEKAYADRYQAKEKELSRVFDEVKKFQGPLELGLNCALEKLHICKQAYHSNAFVGNHCKKIVENPIILLQVIEHLPQDYELYFDMFSKLGGMYKLISASRFLNADEILELQEMCWSYGQWFPVKFPSETVTVKFHLLVFHVPEFVKRWGTIGLLGEQGAESIHRLINQDMRTYGGVREKTEQLKLVSQNHALRSSAKLGHCQPATRVCRALVDGKECKGRFKKNEGNKKVCQKCKSESPNN